MLTGSPSDIGSKLPRSTVNKQTMPDVTSILREIFADHGVEAHFNTDGWLVTNGIYPACRASTSSPQSRNGGYQIRLDVEAQVSSDRVVIESFSDFGSDPQSAFHSSLQNFCTGSLHVMLSALWGVSDPDQVFVTEIRGPMQVWSVHLGNLVQKAEHGIDVPPPEDLMKRIINLLQRADLAPSVHWCWIYYANLSSTDRIVGVLLDNQPWPDGESAIRAASWRQLSSFYSARMFWMMLPKLSTS